jgi:hypothetical protein
MRRFLASVALLTALNSAMAQDRHFLYLQADNEQAFYLKISGETRSSTPAGYMILPRLTDDTLEFVVGFPLRKYPEYRFRLDGFDRDRGYALKDFGEKGWGLFDMQSMEVSMGKPVGPDIAKGRPAPIVAVRDSFASVLASVVDDSAVMDASLIVRKSDIEPGKVENPGSTKDSLQTPASGVQPVVKGSTPDTARSVAVKGAGNNPVGRAAVPSTDSASSAQKTVLRPPGGDTAARAKPDTVAVGMVRLKLPDPPRQVGKPPPMDSLRLPLSVEDSGTMKGVDSSRAVTATGSAMEPVLRNPSISSPSAPTPPKGSIVVRETLKLLEYSDSSGMQLVFSDRDEEGRLDTVSLWMPAGDAFTGNPATNGGEKGKTLTSGRPDRTDCPGMVSTGELGQLRRRMEAIPDEDAKVAAALREFRLRCFTTEQVRSLLVVFFREEGRYKLLDAAYPRVFDPQAFLALEQVLRDPYFIHRFRRLVGLP